MGPGSGSPSFIPRLVCPEDGLPCQNPAERGWTQGEAPAPVCEGPCLRLPSPGPAVTGAPTGGRLPHGRGFWGREGGFMSPVDQGAHLVWRGFPELSDVPERPNGTD